MPDTGDVLFAGVQIWIWEKYLNLNLTLSGYTSNWLFKVLFIFFVEMFYFWYLKLKIFFHLAYILLPLAALSWPEGLPVPRSKLFQFHAVFGKFWHNHVLPPLGEFAPPPRGNPWPATDCIHTLYTRICIFLAFWVSSIKRGGINHLFAQSFA